MNEVYFKIIVVFEMLSIACRFSIWVGWVGENGVYIGHVMCLRNFVLHEHVSTI
jgi:hypothetical protein